MKRRKMPGIEPLGEGLYRIRVRTTDASTGKRIERDRKVLCVGLREAEEKRLELVKELEQELQGGGAKRSTLSDVAIAWLARKIAARRSDGSARLAPTTRERYRVSVEQHIVPFLGERVLEELTPRHIEAWRDHLAGYFHAATVNGHLRVLRTILREADCFAGERVKALAEDDTRITEDEPNLLTEAEVERFIEAAAEIHPQHLTMILVLLTTAVRISTLIAARWEDVDEREGLIHFRRRRSGHEILPGVKRSRKSKDTAPLMPEVLKALRAHRKAMTGIELASGLLFPSDEGGFRSRSLLDDPMKRILERASIEKRFTTHGFRRTAAAFYRRVAGSAISKAIAGHTTDEMHEHYALVSSSEKREAAQRAFGTLQKFVGGSVGGSRRKTKTAEATASSISANSPRI